MGSEIALLLTLMLIVLLKVDLTKEDIPGAEDTVGAALLFANTIPTASSLVLSLLSHGLDARDAIKTWKGDEDDGDKIDKKGKKGKKKVRCTELTPPSLLVVKIIFTEFHVEMLTNCVSA